MRDSFFSELYSLFRMDRRVVFMTGDLGYKLFDKLKDHDPERVINCGIREAGMIGYAAGLAKTGMLPFVYSITPFLTLRCLEQIKIDLCYNRANVVLVGVGGGFAYGPNASTHHGVDDIGVLSCLPDLTIWTPADPREVRLCVKAVPFLKNPAYLRLGRNREPDIFESTIMSTLDIFRPTLVREGKDGFIITSGFILSEVLKAADKLSQNNFYPAVIHITTLRPFPEEYIRSLILNGKPVMTVEEHVGTGGLGQEISRIIAEEGKGNRFQMLAIPLKFPDACYDRDSLLEKSGLDACSISANYKKLCNKMRMRKGGLPAFEIGAEEDWN